MPSTPLLRLALAALFALAASASADAQARFERACGASMDGEAELAFDPAAVCGCAARQAVADGVAGADLDRLMDYVGDDGNLDASALPEPLMPVGEAVVEALLTCALTSAMEASGMPGELAITRSGAAGPDAAAPGVSAAPVVTSDTPVAPRAAPGLRTGNGTGPVRTAAPSPGGAIRIIG